MKPALFIVRETPINTIYDRMYANQRRPEVSRLPTNVLMRLAVFFLVAAGILLYKLVKG